MKRSVLLATCWALVWASPALARNEVMEFDVAAAVAEEQENLPPDLVFFMHGQEHPPVLRDIGTWGANRPAQSAMKSDQAACHRAFASALISLHERARRQGGNAIVDITSRAGSDVLQSATRYRCIAGNILVRVALDGKVVQIAR